MANRIRTPADRVENPPCQPSVDLAAAKSHRHELPTRNNPVLLASESGDRFVGVPKLSFFIREMKNCGFVLHAGDACGARRAGGA